MKTEKEIMNKANELYESFLQKKLENYLTCSNNNCIYNKRHRVRGYGKVGFCINQKLLKDKNQPVYVCNDLEVAKSCSYYECAYNEETVKELYKKELSTPSICGQKYPKLAVLLWVLQDDSDNEKETFQPKLNTRYERFIKSIKDICMSIYDFFSFKWI